MASSSSRRQPTRSVRSSAARPSNYYAKPFSYRSSNVGPADNEPPTPVTPGFFPAITHFTDSVAALPKEVQRHFTMLKETEGKAYQPDQAIAELVTAIKKLPDPPRGPLGDRQHPLMQFSMANSLAGSANGSVVDGMMPRQPAQILAQDGGTQSVQTINEQQVRRQELFKKLQGHIREKIVVLDEKNMVLSAANDTLTRQLLRLNSSFPYIENEVSEEARLGSNTHWALEHMKDMRRATGGMISERTRRDVTNVNNLAAAAAAVHEGEIAATRSEARREAMLAKRSRAHNFDSDFDERAPSRKQTTTSKVRKAPESATALTNGNATHKRRRVEKVRGPSTERSLGAALNGRLGGGRASPRDTPAVEGAAARKKAKPLPAPVPRKKNNTANSPSMASSPTTGTFATSARHQSPAPNAQRINAARARVSSNASLLQDNSRKRPGSAQSGRAKQQKTLIDHTPSHASTLREDTRLPMEEQGSINGNRKISANAAKIEALSDPSNPRDLDGAHSVKREKTEPPSPSTLPTGADAALADQPAFSTKSTNSQPPSRSSKPATPAHNIFTDVPTLMSRSRSTRGANNGSTSATSVTAGSPIFPTLTGTASPRRSHKKGASQSNISAHAAASSPVLCQGEHSTANTRPKRTNSMHKPRPHMDLDTTVASEPDRDNDETNDVDADADADNLGGEEPYCICQKPSEGEMIACDNMQCPREWFHLSCVGLTKAPAGNNEWFCPECRRSNGRAGGR